MTSREMVADAILESRESVKLEIIDKIEEMLAYDGMEVMPSKYALKMVQLYISRMDDTDDEV